MEAWPTVAWVLLMTNIADWLKTVQCRDFTMTDIIQLHPSTTPHPGSFKCFTCEDAPDNYECNRWAPDVYCPKDARYCHTLHMMDNHGDSVSVTKRCGNICNVFVPRNASSAIFSSSSPLISSSTKHLPTALSYFLISICTAAHL
ncbi:hypothetical protein F7725_008970 [Dissostichus mawsoni]|uniref:Ly6/PLAUR domain-containing protein 6 n=1 Tax=Dissostichus mawsoni TaxID=36200 RepID=A0A7J5Z7H3_DISMA|nr:hypothetical protein F7725_008970 [Dissostichus mawsoni]